MLRTIPAAGHPIGPGVLLAGLGAFLGRDREGAEPPEGYRHRWLTASGTAALTLGLMALRESSDRDEVVLPAYTCPSLVTAVLRAGLRPVLCDLVDGGFGLDLRVAPFGPRTLAVIPVHLFGIPDNVSAIRECTRGCGVRIIEDATQCLEPRRGESGRDAVGSLGDLAVFSFGRGKPLSVLGGGAVVANDPALAGPLESVLSRFPEQRGVRRRVRYIATLAIYAMLFHPRLYWAPKGLPFLRLGETRFNPEVDLLAPGREVRAALRAAYREFRRIRDERNRVALLYHEALYGIPGCVLPGGDGSRHSLLRFPILLDDPARRDRVLAASDRRGLGATGMYPAPLHRLDGLEQQFRPGPSFPVAESVSRLLVTLPLHRHVREADVARLRLILAGESR